MIYAPVPLYRQAGALWVEAQAANGLRLWAGNFARVIALMPVTEEAPPRGWVPVSDCPGLERVQIEPIPMAYRPDRFLRALPAGRRQIRALIGQADVLSFAIGGLFGDWGAVACHQAQRLGRPHAVWTDRVESEVTRHAALEGPWRSRLRARLYHRPMAWLERALIRRADLGLFHGAETFAAYAPHSRNPQIVHDIHISQSDHIAPKDLEAKAKAAAEGVLRIAYAGRAEPMKGPMDWLSVLERLDALGVAFEAVWLGDGTELEAMRARAAAAGLQDRIRLPGFTEDRAALLQELRRAHLFLFCHKTPESPRNLIEALISGCALAGYASAYSEDLIAQHPGGELVLLNDVEALARAVAALDRDRARLAQMIRDAAAAGRPFSDVAVFSHRSELLKTYLA
ncbi:glycosyltransferase [Roseobacteraceae bacterium NS-SX3]